MGETGKNEHVLTFNPQFFATKIGCYLQQEILLYIIRQQLWYMYLLHHREFVAQLYLSTLEPIVAF